jgi:hypothetical protein
VKQYGMYDTDKYSLWTQCEYLETITTSTFFLFCPL